MPVLFTLLISLLTLLPFSATLSQEPQGSASPIVSDLLSKAHQAYREGNLASADSAVQQAITIPQLSRNQRISALELLVAIQYPSRESAQRRDSAVVVIRKLIGLGVTRYGNRALAWSGLDQLFASVVSGAALPTQRTAPAQPVAAAPSLTFDANRMVAFTTDPGVDIDPVYTPDGKYVIYASSRSGNLELWMRPVGGGALYQLTSSVNLSADRNPALTPDGGTLIFQSDRVNGTRNIWGMDMRTRALMQLTSVEGGASNPAISSKGDICYTRTHINGTLSIWVMTLQGTNARELGPGLDCTWTPDGRQIVFSRNSNSRGNDQYDLWVMDDDGQNARVLTSTTDAWEKSPVVSPDGKTVVYTSYQGSFGADLQEVPGGFQVVPSLRAALWSVSLTGSTPPNPLTDFMGFSSFATFAADGQTILFTSTRSGSADLWAMQGRK